MKFVVREMYQCNIDCDHTDISKEKIHELTLQQALNKVNDPDMHTDEYIPYDEHDGVDVISDALYHYCDLEVLQVI